MTLKRDVEDLLKAVGKIRTEEGDKWFDIERTKSDHWRVSNLRTGQVTHMSGSPSNRRGIDNAKAQLQQIGFTRDMKENPKKYTGRLRAMENISSTSVQQRVKLIVPRMDTLTTSTAAEWLWKWLKYTEIGGDVEDRYYNGRLGWHWAGRLSEVLERMWPALKELDSEERRKILLRVINYGRGRGYETISQGNPAVLSVYHVYDVWEQGSAPKNDFRITEFASTKESVSTEPPVRVVPASVEAMPEPVQVTATEIGSVETTQAPVDPLEDVLLHAAMEVRDLRELRGKVEKGIREATKLSLNMIELAEDLNAILGQLDDKLR